MGNKEFKTRITQKIDTPENWAKATNFSPLKGEIIISKGQENTSFSVGDGETNVNSLPAIEGLVKNLEPSVELFNKTITLTDGIYYELTPLELEPGDIVIGSWNEISYEAIVETVELEEEGKIAYTFNQSELPFRCITNFAQTTEGVVPGFFVVYVGEEEVPASVNFIINKKEKITYQKIDNGYLNIDQTIIDNSTNPASSIAVTKFYEENRTHWKEGDGDAEIVYFEETITVDSDGLYSEVNAPFYANEEETYNVNWDGTEYSDLTTTEIMIDGGTAVIMGNQIMVDEETNTGEPFVIAWTLMEDGTEEFLILSVDMQVGTHTIKIFKNGTTYHKLDNNYLNIDKKPTRNSTNLTTSGAVYNSFIKNRTHWIQNTAFEPILWDGDITGLPEVSYTESIASLHYYRIANLPTNNASKFEGCSMKTISIFSDEKTKIGNSVIDNSDIIYSDNAIIIGGYAVIITLRDNITVSENDEYTDLDGVSANFALAVDLTFPQKGVYFLYANTSSGSYTSNAAVYDLTPSGVIMPLYDWYIPDTIARTEELQNFISTNKIVNNLYTSDTATVLSGSQGKILNDKINNLKTSDLENDSGFITAESVPTVYDWAKAATKPTYTADEVNAEPAGTIAAHNIDSTAHGDIRDLIAQLPTVETIMEQLSDRLLPDPTSLEDGFTLVVQNGKWTSVSASVSDNTDASTINGISIQVTNDVPDEIDEDKPTLTFIV